MKIIRFKHCYVKIWSDEYLETIFEDGSKVPAMANLDLLDYALSLGYKSVQQMTLHHEVSHTFLCEKAGFQYSPTLWSVAHDQCESKGSIPINHQYEEESLVLDFQKFINLGELGSDLSQFCLNAGQNPYILKEEFQKIFKNIEQY